MYREAEVLKVAQSVTNQAGTPHQIWFQSLSSFPMSSDLNTYLSIKPSPQAWDQSSSWWWVSWGRYPRRAPDAQHGLEKRAVFLPAPAGSQGQPGLVGRDKLGRTLGPPKSHPGVWSGSPDTLPISPTSGCKEEPNSASCFLSSVQSPDAKKRCPGSWCSLKNEHSQPQMSFCVHKPSPLSQACSRGLLADPTSPAAHIYSLAS